MFSESDLSKEKIIDYYAKKRPFDEILWHYCLKYFHREQQGTLEYEELYLYLYLSGSRISTTVLPKPPAKDEKLDQHLRIVKAHLTDSDGPYFITPKQMATSEAVESDIVESSGEEYGYSNQSTVATMMRSELFTKLQSLKYEEEVEQRGTAQKISKIREENQQLSFEVGKETKKLQDLVSSFSRKLNDCNYLMGEVTRSSQNDSKIISELQQMYMTLSDSLKNSLQISKDAAGHKGEIFFE